MWSVILYNYRKMRVPPNDRFRSLLQKLADKIKDEEASTKQVSTIFLLTYWKQFSVTWINFNVIKSK